MAYVLYKSEPYENEIEVASGSLEDMKQALKQEMHWYGFSADYYTIYEETDILVEDLVKEIRSEV